MSGDILDQIDHVLADYTCSPDAMRWTPEPSPIEVDRNEDETWIVDWAELAEMCVSEMARIPHPSPEPPLAFTRSDDLPSIRAEIFGRCYAETAIAASVLDPCHKFNFGSGA